MNRLISNITSAESKKKKSTIAVYKKLECIPISLHLIHFTSAIQLFYYIGCVDIKLYKLFSARITVQINTLIFSCIPKLK